MERMKRVFNPCDECNYSYSKNNEVTNVCKRCEFNQYRKLEEQGLLITLPCKLNEMVYIAHKKYPTHKGLFVSKADIVSCLEEGYVIGSTKEEALQKLKELENV